MRNSLSFLSTKPVKFHPAFPFQSINQPTLYCNQKGSSCSTWRKSARALSKSCTYKKPKKKKLHKRSFAHQQVLAPRFFSICLLNTYKPKNSKKKILIRTQSVSYAIFVKSMIFVLYIISMSHLEYIYTNTCNTYILYNTYINPMIPSRNLTPPPSFTFQLRFQAFKDSSARANSAGLKLGKRPLKMRENPTCPVCWRWRSFKLRKVDIDFGAKI